MNFPKWIISVSSSFFYVWKAFFFSELHPDVAFIAGSKELIGNPNSEANTRIGINLSSSPVPDLNRIMSKKVRFLTLWHNNVKATSLSDKLWFYSREHYRKETWFTQTFLCQLIRGWNQNRFCYCFYMLEIQFYHPDFTNKFLEKWLKFLMTFLSIFWKAVLLSCYYWRHSQVNCEVTLRFLCCPLFQFCARELNPLSGFVSGGLYWNFIIIDQKL